jgi:putative endopeptidase
VERRDPHNTYHMETIAELEQADARPSTGRCTSSVQGAPEVAKLNVSQPEFMKAVETELTTETWRRCAAICAFIC